MIVKRSCCLIGILVICTAGLFATGASSLSVGIHPVSVSREGAVLCRTRVQANASGFIGPAPVTYGWMIIFPDQYILPVGELQTHEYYDFDLERYQQDNEKFRQGLDGERLSPALEAVVKEYGFKKNNAGIYFVSFG